LKNLLEKDYYSEFEFVFTTECKKYYILSPEFLSLFNNIL